MSHRICRLVHRHCSAVVDFAPTTIHSLLFTFILAVEMMAGACPSHISSLGCSRVTHNVHLYIFTDTACNTYPPPFATPHHMSRLHPGLCGRETLNSFTVEGRGGGRATLRHWGDVRGFQAELGRAGDTQRALACPQHPHQTFGAYI